MGEATALTLADESDDGEGLGDLPSTSSPAVDMFPESSGSSSKEFNKVVHKRSKRAS